MVALFKIIDPPKSASLINYEARIWYTWKKTKIEKLISKEKTLESKAKNAFELRNEYRSATRKYMKDKKCAEILNISDWLKAIDSKGKITIEEAWDAFDGVVSHAKQIGNNKKIGISHSHYKKACESCVNILEHFNIKEYKIK